MNFAEIFVRHRVLAYMISLAALLFGLLGFKDIGVDRLPDVNAPLILVTTANPGSSPEIIDSSITNVLESAINSVSSIEMIRSVSSPGMSQVVIEFKVEKGVDAAFNEVQAKINQVINELPKEAETPVVAKIDPNSTPVVWLVMQGDRSLPALNQLARDKVKKNLETIHGVGEVVIGGGRERKMRVDLDLTSMAALQVTVDDVIAAFGREHVQLPGGYLVAGKLEKLLHLDLEYHSSEELQELVVMWRNNVPVLLRDIANISDSLDDMRSLARFDGVDGVAIAVRKVQNANTVEITEDIEKRLENEIRPLLPDGVRLTMAINEADVIQGIVKGLQAHLIEGTVLAAFVVWLFLLNLPATLIISAAIPVSLAASILFMDFSGYTFNMLTLSALLLLIGVVVDDAIVVLENIHRQHEAGVTDPEQAAITGTREVVFPVLAASLTLVCIFASVIFMQGMIGVFLRSFAMVVTIGVLASMLVSFSLTPALCASHLKAAPEKPQGGIRAWIEKQHAGMEAKYQQLLSLVMQHRVKTLLITGALLMSTVWFFGQLSTTMFPRVDESRFQVNLETPQGSSIYYVIEKIETVENIVRQQPEVKHILSSVESSGGGEVNKASIKIILEDSNQRQRSQMAIMTAVQQALAEQTGFKYYVREFSILDSIDSQPFMAYVTGPDLAGVAHYARLIHQRLDQHGGMGNLRLDLALDRPMLSFAIDRARAQELGISAQQIGNTVRVLAGGADIARFNPLSGNSERYDVRLAAQHKDMADTRDLEQVYLRASSGQLLPLSAVTNIEEKLGPATISRMDLNIGAGLSSSPDIGVGNAIKLFRETAAELLPPGYGIVLYGESDKLEETSTNILFVFLSGLVLVYMVLASQFNSFMQPLLVMLAQPLAIVGGVAALWATGGQLDMFSMIGLFLLVGLVSKNSILLVDLINRYRDEGMETGAAIYKACPARMRPVLMTSLTIILAMLPASLGIGEGAETYGSLAIAVIGGIVSSTALTLVVVPVAYSLLERWLEKRDAYWEQK